jgi:hypothetical protein
MKFREASGPQDARDPVAWPLAAMTKALFLVGYSMSDGRLIPTIITVVICGLLSTRPLSG